MIKKAFLPLIVGVASCLAWSASTFASCEYAVQNHWGSGFVAGIKITNSSDSVLSSWRVEWQYEGDNRVTAAWNATLAGNNPYSADSLSWNGALQPGQSVEFGVMGSSPAGGTEIPRISGSVCGSGSTSSEIAGTSSASSTSSSSVMPVSSAAFSSATFSSTMVSSQASSAEISSSAAYSSEESSVMISSSMVSSLSSVYSSLSSISVVDPEFTFCGYENDICTVDGTREVKYGAEGLFFSKIVTGSVDCTNAVFGDPIPGVLKACYYAPENLATNELLIQENEGGFCSVQGSVDSNNGGYTGSGFANTENVSGATVVYSVNASYPTEAILDVRFATTSNRSAGIRVNGTYVGSLSLVSTGSWTSWTSESVTVPLQQGSNRIELVAETTAGLPNIDSLKITGDALSVGDCTTSTPDPDTASDCNSVSNAPVVTVASDGSASYRTVQSAINSIASSNQQQTYIKIKPGRYYEKLVVNRPNITLCGQSGREAATVITYNDTSASPNGQGGTLGTYGSTSVAVTADDVSFENLTLENSHGPGIQAVAVRISADRVQFRNTRFIGAQDTLYIHSGSQYFKDCYIEGTVDFIFGGATAVFENCHMHNIGEGTAITAPSTDQARPYGIVFLGGKATAGSNVRSGHVALGRNWRPYGSTTFIRVNLGDHIAPEGWRAMGDNTLYTSRFAEYQSSGPGANPSMRAYPSRQLSDAEASKYTVSNIFENWVPLYSKAQVSGENAPTLSQEGNPAVNRFKRYSKEWSLTTSQADMILSHQLNNGGWPKNQSYDSWGSGGYDAGSIDNGATTLEMSYMAEMYRRTGDNRYRDSARKAMNFLLEMQYDTGAFPQIYPLRGGYSDHATFNDNAMSRALTALHYAALGEAPFNGAIFSDSDRSRFKAAVKRGVDYILKSQWKQNGRLTVWCAQHGATDYQPKDARAYELKSLSGSESAEVIAFLMTQPQTTEIKTAVKAALAWFRSSDTILENYKYDRSTEQKIVYSPGDRMWYRFYNLYTNRGFFSDRDGGTYYDLMTISQERRDGYSWGGSWGESILSYARSVGY